MQFIFEHKVTARLGIYAVIILSFSLTANGEHGEVNWNQFRGANGQGTASSDRIPVHFGPESNVLWKTAIGAGQSSPVIWNERIFLTAVASADTTVTESAEATVTETGDEKELETLCIDRKNGEVLWRRTIRTDVKARMHPMNGPASSSPAVDGKHVYVYFATYGLLCYDHAGGKVWERKIDTPKNQFGMATSPILYDDKVILLLDGNGGDSRLLAVNRDSGETVWEQPRSFSRAGWSTPMIWRHGDAEEIVVLGFKRLASYNAATGEEIWWAGGFSPETVGIPVTGEGLLFVSDAAMAGRGEEKWDAELTWKIIIERFDSNNDNQIQRDEMTKGFTIPLRPELAFDNPGWGLPTTNMEWLMKYIDKDKDKIISKTDWMETMVGFSMDSRPTLMAVRPGAKGDARKAHVVWEINRGPPETSSILYCQGKLYLLRDGGLLTCIEASSGKEIFRERIGATGQYMASPVVAGDKIIVASTRGTVTIIQVADELKVLARNKFAEKISATPAIADNKIYLRTAGHLYALGE